MLPMKRARTQSTEELESATQGNVEAKRELAKRLMKETGVEEDCAKAASLLENCAALGDADSMLMLARCCALGCGTERNAARAEGLISEAAEQGSKEAQHLVELINEYKRRTSIDLNGLRCFKDVFHAFLS